MEYRALGQSGLRVSVLTMGTMTFGGSGPFKNVGSTDVQEARRQVDMCLDAGVNLIDTADVYSDGQSEEIVGEVLSELLAAARSARDLGVSSRGQVIVEARCANSAGSAFRERADDPCRDSPEGRLGARSAVSVCSGRRGVPTDGVNWGQWKNPSATQTTESHWRLSKAPSGHRGVLRPAIRRTQQIGYSQTRRSGIVP